MKPAIFDFNEHRVRITTYANGQPLFYGSVFFSHLEAGLTDGIQTKLIMMKVISMMAFNYEGGSHNA